MNRTFIFIVITILTLLFYCYLFNNKMVQRVDYLFYDFTIGRFYKEAKQDSYVVIVDIDEKSIESIGQWPWSRLIDAKLINKISLGFPSALGINIIFPEIDKTSPVFIQNFYKKFFDINISFDSLPTKLIDNDKLLIDAIENINATFSIYLDIYPNIYKYCENISYQNNFFSKINTPFKAPYILCNHQKLQESIKNFGFINADSDSDGILRRIPIFMGYRDKIFPSFALAILLSIDSDVKIVKKNQLKLLERKINMNSDSTVLINPNTSMPKAISAVDILRGNISPNIFKGKIVLLGSSITGLNPQYILANKHKISSTKIHASVIENILSNSLITQPDFYKKFNIYVSLILSLLIILMLSKRWYISILILSIIIIFLSLIYLFVGYKNHIYISIGYLLTPFLIYFFIVTTFFIIINSMQQKRFYKELIESHASAVESISLIAAIRDDETGEHLKRTKLYIKELAQYLYNQKQYPNILNKKYIENIYHAAPLHDIGKLGIPDNILKKPGKFTPEEYEIMKQHPKLAKEAIEKAMRHYDKNDFLNIASNIAYYHHEQWDGKGYPVGLKGDEIPLEAQLMSIADVYDALVTKRCYKEKFDFKKAEDIIINGSGKNYNPIVVDAFKTLRYKFRDIANSYKDA